MGVPVDQLLFSFGRHFVKAAKEDGYEEVGAGIRRRGRRQCLWKGGRLSHAGRGRGGKAQAVGFAGCNGPAMRFVAFGLIGVRGRRT